ncbi:MAG: amino acid adenylation domain-containing protein [Coleofasciculaceae cyanobacterium RL_1_1]|nr:amino acid adenylation domain-containing protein [Coleofasciculaceae cyanobacterium RL_1_1]
MSYGDLITQAQTLGKQLVAAGVQPDDRVAIHLPRSCEAIVGVLAILFSGAAYLPLDPEAPIARTVQLVNDAHPVLAIVKTGYELPFDQTGLLQYNLDQPPQFSVVETLPAPRGDRLAYVIYTSGSTGQPKGVAIEHQALAQFTAAALQRYDIGTHDRVLQFAGLHFDASVEEIFTSLCAGATLVLRDPLMLQSIPQFLRACDQQRITVIDLPTAFWHELAFYLAESFTGSTTAVPGDHTVALRPGLPPALRMVIIGGEAALPQRVTQWHAAVGDRVTLWNTYGPSETTVVATAAHLTRSVSSFSSVSNTGDVPIGRPLPGVDIVVTDALGQPVAIGEPGELCILGATVARGYLGRSQLTADRFVLLEALPQRPRAYRTGDRVRLNSDGQLSFLGRLDAEFKISGHRVEPTEIEALLITISGIREAAVIGHRLPNGGKRLCAYLVAAAAPPSARSVRQQLAAVLPAAIVPAEFQWIEELPKTRSGKVDRVALSRHTPQGLSGDRGDETLAPLEAFVLEAWERVLGQSQLTLQDDFFELGGQSLQTIQVATWLGTKLGCDLPISLLFEHPTAAELAQALRSRSDIDRDRLNSPDRHETSPLTSQPSLTQAAFAPRLPITPPTISDKRSPWLCLPPAAGLSWCYLGIARALQQPLYGFQSPYLDGNLPTTDRPIQDRWSHLIDYYLTLLRQAQPNGSYRLLGWSFGGLLAQALACRLQQDGETVEQLVLLDAYPSQQLVRRGRPSNRDILALLLQATGQYPEDVQHWPTDHDAALNDLQRGNLGTHLDSDRLNALFGVTRLNVELARQAPIPNQFDGDLTFITATEGRTNLALHHRVWQPFITGVIHNHDVEVEHGRLLSRDAIAAIVQVVAAL